MIGVTFWLSRHCGRHPRVSGGVVVLLRHLNAWLRGQGLRECSRDEFKNILADAGLSVIEVAGVLFVPGLGLAEDSQLAEEYWHGKFIRG